MVKRPCSVTVHTVVQFLLHRANRIVRSLDDFQKSLFLTKPSLNKLAFEVGKRSCQKSPISVDIRPVRINRGILQI